MITDNGLPFGREYILVYISLVVCHMIAMVCDPSFQCDADNCEERLTDVDATGNVVPVLSWRCGGCSSLKVLCEGWLGE